MSADRARGSRKGRVLQAFHGALTDGVTVADLADAAECRPYEVRQILSAEVKRQRAKVIDHRTEAGSPTPVEVWACTCPLTHRTAAPVAAEIVSGPLERDDVARGLSGLAAARARLEQAPDRLR